MESNRLMIEKMEEIKESCEKRGLDYDMVREKTARRINKITGKEADDLELEDLIHYAYIQTFRELLDESDDDLREVTEHRQFGPDPVIPEKKQSLRSMGDTNWQKIVSVHDDMITVRSRSGKTYDILVPKELQRDYGSNELIAEYEYVHVGYWGDYIRGVALEFSKYHPDRNVNTEADW